MIEIHIHNGERPYGYSRWTEFYNRFDPKKVKAEDLIQYDEHWVHGYRKFTYTQDYLKARCYDELLSNDFTIDELHEIHMCVHQYGYSDTKTKEKVSKLLSIRHEEEMAERLRKA